MAKEAVFTMKLEPELRTEFMAAAAASHRPASQIIREMMRDFIQKQREPNEYNEFLRRKVETARLSVNTGVGRSNETVEKTFSVKRAKVAD